MSIMIIGIVGITSVLLAVQLKGTKSEYGIYLVMAAGCFMFFYGAARLESIVEGMRRLQDYVKIRPVFLTVSYTHLDVYKRQAVEGALAKGVTISKYQNKAGEIDWNQVRGDGVSFAMVRLGYLNDLDPYFAANMQAASAHGIRTGVFFYTQALDEETARQEARFVLEQIKDYPVSYPVAYDVESQYLLDMGKTPQEITSQVNAFCQVIAEAGYRPVVYANNEWLTRHMDTSQIPYDIWYARYETSVNEYPNRTIWQYTKDGTVAGITGKVCICLLYTSIWKTKRKIKTDSGKVFW